MWLEINSSNNNKNSKQRSLLNRFAILLVGVSFSVSAQLANAEKLGFPEKEELKFGFIKLTDMAPLAIAKELGYFEDEGLFVTIEAQSNWKNVLDRVIDGQLDGSHMLAGQPIAAGAGFGRQCQAREWQSFDSARVQSPSNGVRG